MPIIRAIFGLIVYVISLFLLTSIGILIYQIMFFIGEREWIWIWDYNTQHAFIIIMVLGALSNWVIEDECKTSCKDKIL